MNKKDIRKEVYAKRKTITFDEQRILNDKLYNQVARFVAKVISENESQIVFMYVSYGMEADTLQLFSYLKQLNMKVAFPKVMDTTNRIMSFYKVDDLLELEIGYKNIPEPTGNVVMDDVTNDAIVIVPIVAFSDKCKRVGYGGGFYDTYLSSHKFKKVIGIAFEYQHYDDMDMEEHDKTLDFIVTEERIYGGLYE